MSIMTPGSIAGVGLLADATGSTSVPSDAGVLERKFGPPDATEEVTQRLVEKLKAQGGYNNLARGARPLPGITSRGPERQF